MDVEMAAAGSDKHNTGTTPIAFKENPMSGDGRSMSKDWGALPTSQAEASVALVERTGRANSTNIDVDESAGGINTWTKVLDPETGRPFYFNETTGVSSWHPTKGANIIDATKQVFKPEQFKAMSPKQVFKITEQEV